MEQEEFIESKEKEFWHFENETDWQDMHGGDLVDVDQLNWLRNVLKEAIDFGRNFVPKDKEEA